ncbi:SpaA isopeptide-forming pilin-related protein [Bacillus sp. B6(2022)]|nr:SpaA isopeptide-forming pilin-related protein [Bacillus sp. B6(2022)]
MLFRVKKENVEEITCNGSKGKLHINDLKPGEYQFVETKAPHGYELDDQPIRFTIEKNQQKPLQLTAKNHLILGSLRIIKVDQQTDRTLKGAAFDIRTKAGKTIKSVTTGKDGEAIVKGLKPGEYTITETKAPNGYVALKNHSLLQFKWAKWRSRH